MPEVAFKCEVCGEEFPPDPSGLVEVGIDSYFVAPEQVEEELANGALLADDPAVNAWRKGVMFMCLSCQDKAIKESEEDDGRTED